MRQLRGVGGLSMVRCLLRELGINRKLEGVFVIVEDLLALTVSKGLLLLHALDRADHQRVLYLAAHLSGVRGLLGRMRRERRRYFCVSLSLCLLVAKEDVFITLVLLRAVLGQLVVLRERLILSVLLVHDGLAILPELVVVLLMRAKFSSRGTLFHRGRVRLNFEILISIYATSSV